MKILITGASGMLAADLRDVLAPNHDLILADVVGDTLRMDITDTDSVMEIMKEYRPDTVIHAAAYTDVDGCERDPDRAFRVNGLGSWNIAAACREIDAAMVYVSTDFVFDGEKGEPYTEYDATNPISFYGASKLAGESHVRQVCPKHFICRTAWLYGVHGKNFPYAVINRAKSGQPLSVVSDQIGSPTFTADLSLAIKGIIGSPLYGTYHMTNKGSCSWFDFAKRILSLAGLADVEITPIKGKDWPSPTRRPKYSVLRHLSLELQGKDDLRDWEEALKDFISRIP